jgi:hypothetical protein
MMRRRPSPAASHHGLVKSSGVGRSKRVVAIVAVSFALWSRGGSVVAGGHLGVVAVLTLASAIGHAARVPDPTST